jgi:hypothetical protein
VRQRLKAPGAAIAADQAAALRAQVKRLELDAEHIEPLALAAALPAGDPPPAPAPANAAQAVGLYLDRLDVSVEETDRTHLMALLAAAFPAALREDIGVLVQGLSRSS